MIKQVLYSVLAKYRGSSVARGSSQARFSPPTNHYILLNLVQQLAVISLMHDALLWLYMSMIQVGYFKHRAGAGKGRMRAIKARVFCD